MLACLQILLVPDLPRLTFPLLCRPPPLKPYVCAQQYVPNPCLIQQRKFGIRVWVLVTGHDPLRVYIHRWVPWGADPNPNPSQCVFFRLHQC